MGDRPESAGWAHLFDLARAAGTTSGRPRRRYLQQVRPSDAHIECPLVHSLGSSTYRRLRRLTHVKR
jgi:hypothetical protein